jgi:hypothetical protein
MDLRTSIEVMDKQCPGELFSMREAWKTIRAALSEVAQPAQATNSASLSIPALCSKYVGLHKELSIRECNFLYDFAGYAQEQQAVA